MRLVGLLWLCVALTRLDATPTSVELELVRAPALNGSLAKLCPQQFRLGQGAPDSVARCSDAGKSGARGGVKRYVAPLHVKRRLAAFYAPYNERLRRVLGDGFDWERTSYDVVGDQPGEGGVLMVR